MNMIMSEFTANMLTSATGLAALSIISLAMLRGWRDWIALKREELARYSDHIHGGGGDAAVPHAGSRIEIADLKERLRKLEAIAAGVDL